MPEMKRSWLAQVGRRLEQYEKRTRQWERKVVNPKRLAVLGLGAALSVGGVSETFRQTQFLVEKNLDGVQVVRTSPGEQKVVANMTPSFKANSVYKIARVIPDSLVAERANLFESAWLELEQAQAEVADGGEAAGKSLHTKIALINDAIAREFFETKIPYGEIIHEKAEKYGVDPALVAAVMEQESRFKHRARSPVGALGLMQLMPRTGRWMGARNLYDPEQNIDAGTKYLKYLDKRFKGNQKKIIAAYNAGEGNVKRYGGVPPFRETRTYVKKVMNNYEKRKKELHEYGMDEERAPLAAR